jgi:hypothetical protein
VNGRSGTQKGGWKGGREEGIGEVRKRRDKKWEKEGRRSTCEAGEEKRREEKRREEKRREEKRREEKRREEYRKPEKEKRIAVQ